MHNPSLQAAPPWEALSTKVADALRPALPGLVAEVIAAVKAAVPEYAAVFDEGVELGVHQGLEGFLELIAAGTRAQLPAREVYVNFGRAQVRAGRSLEDLLTAYRAGAQAAWRGFAQAGDAALLEPRELYALAEAIFAYIDELSSASAEGFTREQSLAAREQHEQRRTLLELLFSEPQPSAQVERLARAAGWTLPERVAALAFQAQGAQRVAARLPHFALVAQLDELGWALIPDPQGPGRRAQLEAALRRFAGGLGPTVSWREVGRSARRAALALKVSHGRPGLHVAEEHLLDLLLASDRELAGELARQRLAPFDRLAATKRERLLETLRAWLDAQGDARAAADELHVHAQTVRYRLGQLRDLLGEALDGPEGRLELALALRVTEGRGAAR